jgi:uncharacterized protein (TIGR02145 family)
MDNKNEKNTSIIPIGSTGLVRVGNSIEITNKIIKEHDERSISELFKSIKIGYQEWMTKNLEVECYANGDSIPEVKNPDEWESLKTGAWCYYDNDSKNGKIHGKLYNWFAVNDFRGLAPKGWHIPTAQEWTTLTNYLGGESIATIKMKSTNGWENSRFSFAENGNNESGFSGLPAGYRYPHNAFHLINELGFWWSSSEYDYDNAWYRTLHHSNSARTANHNENKKHGASVRCLRD